MEWDIIFEKERRLGKILGSFKRVMLAFSGGVDSTYLLYKTGEILGFANIIAVNARLEFTTAKAAAESEILAEQLGATLTLLPLNLLGSYEIAYNTSERCYYCKKAIFQALADRTANLDFEAIFDGTNADDLRLFRPGLKALTELGIRSPLLEAGLTKAEIRILSQQAKLPTWDKPAEPCLATRFPRGEKIQLAMLKAVEEGEAYLRKNNIAGNLRVRVHGQLARIEADPNQLPFLIEKRKMIGAYFRKLGFSKITIDLDGYRTGSMD
jgi:pyridinium-3,5-biscarboxylic acid mononucleotide sulfurtransferase